MASSQWSRAMTLFNTLVEADPADPEAWLDDRCGDDPALRAEVWSLWQAYEEGPLSGDVRGADWLDASGAIPGSITEGLDPAYEAGARIGAYRVTGDIGMGGMSVVYRAERDEGDYDRTVAIKLLQRRLHADDAEARFRAERQVLASLDHPNIARLLDGGVTEDGRPYLVMEYVDGVPLTQYAEANALDLDARLDLLQQVADAVQAAHGSLVVHRDLKPSNVLVTEAGETPTVKLLDFGIAKLLDDSLPVTRPETQTGHHLMTPSYAAPEQVRRQEITVSTDVYQLGVLPYELLAGTRPLDTQGKHPTEVERLVVETDPARPSEKATVPSVPARALRGDLNTIVLTALRKEPGRPTCAGVGGGSPSTHGPPPSATGRRNSCSGTGGGWARPSGSSSSWRRPSSSCSASASRPDRRPRSPNRSRPSWWVSSRPPIQMRVRGIPSRLRRSYGEGVTG